MTELIYNAASGWHKTIDQLPDKHKQVLVKLRNSVGNEVCDVACRIDMREDGTEWILADASLNSKQITHWADIYTPEFVEENNKKWQEERDSDPFSDADYFESGYCT